jgi:aldehyde:ferredoxin oxidoreductase
LSSRTVRKEPLDPELIRGFVGGRGVNSKILFNELQPGVDPLGPENKIVIGTGPCNGTLAPGSSRFTVSSKSPLTGFLGDSNAGGFFGASLKYAGYDGIIIEGKADSPVYLWIDDDKVELKSAKHLMGKTPRETTRTIQRSNSTLRSM